MNKDPKLIIVTGPTASGKTRRAVDIAKAMGGEVISADSRQIYRGMDIGTGKDIEEYGSVPCHLIDIAPAGYRYNLYEFLRDYAEAEAKARSRGKQPVVCGGTGLYVESIAKGLRLPEVPANPDLRASLEGKSLSELAEILAEMKTLHNTTDIDTAKRAIRAIEIAVYYKEHPNEAVNTEPHPRKDAVVIGVDIPRDARRQRISSRLDERLQNGMVDEARGLLEQGLSADDLIYYGLEYKFLALYLTGQMSYDEMKRQLEIAIHQFAKRQMTWFRGMEKRGTAIHWLPYDLPAQEFVDRVIELCHNHIE